MNISPMPEMAAKELMDSDSDQFNELAIDWNEWSRNLFWN